MDSTEVIGSVPELTSPEVAISFQPLGRKGQVPAGISVLEAARRLGVGLSGVCGGAGVCGTCRVVIPPEYRDAVSPISDTERERLGEEAVARGVRLACRALIRRPLQAFVPPESLTASQRTQVEGRQTPVQIDPVVVSVDLHLSPPTLSDLRSDAERIRDGLSRPVRLDLEVLRRSPPSLREWSWAVRAVLRGDEVVALLPPGTPLVGVAVDLGTTKLAGYLVNLETGETIASAGAMNPQLAYGEDVMARITYALQEPEGAERLRQAAADGISRLVGDLCAAAGTRTEQIVEAVVVGNTAMHHLFLGLPVRPWGWPRTYRWRARRWTFRPGRSDFPWHRGDGPHSAQRCRLRRRRPRGGPAGDPDGRGGPPDAALDIGTQYRDRPVRRGNLFSCSAASGPAFEGAHIRFGMRAPRGRGAGAHH